MTNQKRNIYLVQANHQFGNNVFLPYSVGLIQAYCQTIPEIAEAFEFQGFTYLRKDPDTIAKAMTNPSVLGISCYIWNWEWSKALAKAVKQNHPDCLIVMGGPQVPVRSMEFFAEHGYVDLLVHHEGETAFSDVLIESLNGTPDYTKINGLSVGMADGVCFQTPPSERLVDLENIPSPYLNGVFDSLMDGPYDFHASQETHRGCPYSCAFCDWGSAVFTKVRRISDERLKAEMSWFGKYQIELLYNCDANYGLFDRDQGLTEFLVQTKQQYGFPAQFRAAYAKNSDTKVFKLAKMLNDADMSKGVTLSLQSLNTDTLDKIRRSNIKSDTFRELINDYRREGIGTYTELIIGLPGESYDSFVDGIDQLLQAGQHEGLNMYLCNVLPNSEMGAPEYIEKHGIQFVTMPILHQHSSPSTDGIEEFNKIVVETNTMSREDFKRIFLLCWAIQSLHCLGLTQLIAIFLHNEAGLSYSRLYEDIISFAEANPTTLLGQQLIKVSKTVDDALEGQNWGEYKPEFGDILWPNEEASFLDFVCQKPQFYDELLSFFRQTTAKEYASIGPDLLEDLVSFQQYSIIGPHTPAASSFDTRFDLHDYFQGLENGTRCPIKKTSRTLTAATDMVFDGNLELYAQQMVWYGRKSRNRRAVILSEAQESAEDLTILA